LNGHKTDTYNLKHKLRHRQLPRIIIVSSDLGGQAPPLAWPPPCGPSLSLRPPLAQPERRCHWQWPAAARRRPPPGLRAGPGPRGPAGGGYLRPPAGLTARGLRFLGSTAPLTNFLEEPRAACSVPAQVMVPRLPRTLAGNLPCELRLVARPTVVSAKPERAQRASAAFMGTLSDAISSGVGV
jgi:hypothetical protein